MSIVLKGLAPQTTRTFNGRPSQPLNILGTIGDAMVDAKGKIVRKLRTPFPEDKFFFLDAVNAKGDVVLDENGQAEDVALIYKSNAVKQAFEEGKLAPAQILKLQVNQWIREDGEVAYTAMFLGTQRGHLDTTKLIADAKKAAAPTRVSAATAEVMAYVL